MTRMPESGGAGWVGIIIGGLSFLSGMALSLVGLGKKIQSVETGIKSSHDRHDKQDKRIDSLETATKSMMAVFTREDGEPRFITRIACEREKIACHGELFEKFASGAARFGVIEDDIREIKESQATNVQLIIEEIRKQR